MQSIPLSSSSHTANTNYHHPFQHDDHNNDTVFNKNDQKQLVSLEEEDNDPAIHAFPLSLSAEDNAEVELEKTMTLGNGFALIIGISIGSGIFASPGPIYKFTNSIGMSLVIWICGGLLAITGALCYVELGTMFPTSGGEHPYLLKAYGSLPAFLFSWTGILVTRPGSIAIITVIFAEYMCRLIYFSHPGDAIPTLLIRFVAVIAIILLTAVNIISTKLGNRIQDVFTALKLISIFIISITGIIRLIKGSPYIQPSTLFFDMSKNPGDYALALYSALWAFDGWNNLNLVAGELKEPAKNLPKAVISGTSVVIVCYVLANIAYYAELDPETVKNSNSVAMDFGKMAFGSIGGIVVPLIVLGSTFGAANASVFTGSRVSFVSANHGHAPEFLGKLHSKFETPINALIVQGIISIIFVSIGSFTSLVNFYSVIAWIFYSLAVLGLLVLRWTDPITHRPFRIWIAIPIVFCAVTVFLIVFSVMEAPIEAIGALCFMISGVPIWWIVVYKDIPWEEITTFVKNKFKGINTAHRRSQRNTRRKTSKMEWKYTKFDDDNVDLDDIDALQFQDSQTLFAIRDQSSSPDSVTSKRSKSPVSPRMKET